MMIREALSYEAQAVLDLYHSVIDGIANSPYNRPSIIKNSS